MKALFLALPQVPIALDGDLLKANPFDDYLTTGDASATDNFSAWAAETRREVENRFRELALRIENDVRTQAQFDNHVLWGLNALREKLAWWRALKMFEELHRRQWCPTPLYRIRLRNHLKYLLGTTTLLQYPAWGGSSETSEWKAMHRLGLSHPIKYGEARSCIALLTLDYQIWIDAGPAPMPRRGHIERPSIKEYRENCKLYYERGVRLTGFDNLGSPARTDPKPERAADPTPPARTDPKPERAADPTPPARGTEAPSPKDVKIADRLNGYADKLDDKIEKLLHRHEGVPLTNKRRTEREQGRLDARRLEQLQNILCALARAWRQGQVPAVLAKVKTKAAAEELAVLLRAYDEGWAEKFSLHNYERLLKAGITDDAVAYDALRSIGASSVVEATDEIKRARLEDDVALSRPPGFFPTPREVVVQMIEEAEIEKGHRILEPSAGAGAILDVLRMTLTDPWCPDANFNYVVHWFEINPRLRAILTLKRYDHYNAPSSTNDFLQVPAPIDPARDYEGQPYDRILMNPPFESGADMDHVQRAVERWLKPGGGRCVAIMSSGTFNNGTNKHRAFRTWLDGFQHTLTGLPTDAFKKSGTSVSAVLVTIVK